MESRQIEVVAMSPVEKRQLRINQQRFSSLPRSEQERLREFEQELAARRDGERLRQVMFKYHDWVESLPKNTSADLRRLGSTERLSRITKLHEEDRRRRTVGERALDAEDRRIIADWFQRLALSREQELIMELPATWRAQLDSLTPVERQKTLTWLLRQHLQFFGPRGLANPLADLQELATQLSPAAQGQLAASASPRAKFQLMRDWIQVSLRERWSNLQPPIPETELSRFVREELSPQQQTQFGGARTPAKTRQLRQLYLQQKFYSSRGPRRPGLDRPPVPPRPGRRTLPQNG